VWSIGGNMTAASWEPWDEWVRDRFPLFPGSGLVRI
jgi:hypothetical protein